MLYTKWNEGWKFWEEKNAFSLVWNIPENACDITLPHDAMLERNPEPCGVNGGDTAYREGGSYVYVKLFSAPDSWKEQIVQLKFEAVYMNALVYLNGQLVAQRPYGYSAFIAPLNDYLNYGGENELRVLVKNIGPNSRWYSGSGITRDVWLLTASPLHIPDGGLKVSTEYIEDDYACVTVGLELLNRDFRRRKLEVVTEIYTPEGQLCACTSQPLSIPGGSEESFSQTLNISSPLLWTAESPSLCRCVCRLVSDSIQFDSSESFFGIRTLSLDARKGLRVNGKTVKLRGACVHHDNGLLGAVSPIEAEMRRVRILKEAGFNAIRMAHNPASSALLTACDRLGMYVMDEAFDMWTRPKKDNDYALFMEKWWKDDIKSMVLSDYNHPCVVFYSLGNEIPEVGTARGSALGREMARYIKALDPKRYAMVSINGVFASGDHIPQIMSDVISAAASRGEDVGNVNDFMTAMDTHMDAIVQHPLVSERIEAAAVGMDLVGYNYMASRYEPDAVNYPHRVIMGSETYPPHIARNWALVKKLPSVIGDFTWTGWDYIGEAGVGIPAYRFGEGGFGAQYPCQLAYCGDIDITGFRRPLSYMREIVFGLRKAPYITVQSPVHYGENLIKTPWVLSDSISSWTYPGFEGKNVVVEVYSAGEEVELILNGVSLGRKPAGNKSGFIAHFDIIYSPGILEAVSYKNGAEIGRFSLVSADGASVLLLEKEAAEGDISYVNITLCDNKGCISTSEDSLLNVSVSGGQLLGFGSGDPKPLYPYNGNLCRSFNGRALAIVRGSGELTVNSDSGLSAAITF